MALCHLLLEERVRIAALGLGMVHRGIGMPDQGFGIHSIVRVNADADARTDM